MFDARPTVVALGGNAISPAGEAGAIAQQFAHTRQTARLLADLVAGGYPLVITHGNGPQVGNVLRRVELSAGQVYTLPLDVCGADTQGGMGYMIAQCLTNELLARGLRRSVTALVTMVEVARDDPALQSPTKPIGAAYDATTAADMPQRYGWRMMEVRPGQFRRVVPSPIPLAILAIDLIRRLSREGELLIVAGGGGIPVTRGADGSYVGVEAVIDKDRTSALLAAQIGAGTLLIATDVGRVAIDFGKPTQRELSGLTIAEARRHLADGQFPAGSMGPKIEAAISFVESCGQADCRAVICDLAHVAAALRGESGTEIVAG